MDLPTYLSTWLFYETSSFFQVDNIKNAALLRDFLILWRWPHQTESNSARPPFFKLTTSKTKQFCETSFIFELNNVKNEAILRDFFIFHTWQHQKQSNSATAKHHGPEAHPCTCRCRCLMMLFWSLKKRAPNAAAKFPKVRLCESQTPRPLASAFLQCTPCWWPGSVNRDIFAKVPRKLCEGVGESQRACWRGSASKPSQKNLVSNNLSWEGIPSCASCMFKRLSRSDAQFGRWWTNLQKRRCWPTWAPRKINIEFAKVSRK